MSMELLVAIVGIVVAIASIVVSVVIARRYRDRRELSYQTQPTPRLLSVDEAIRDRIEIRYEDREVKNLSGITVTLRSSGNKAIRLPKDNNDYEEPITIFFGEGTEIIGTPRISETVPDDLGASLEVIDSATVKLNPISLNPGQSISIFTLLTNLQGEVEVNGHIEDTLPLRKIESAQRSSLLVPVFGAFGGVLITGAIVGIGGIIGWALAGTVGMERGIIAGVVVVGASGFIVSGVALWGKFQSRSSKE